MITYNPMILIKLREVLRTDHRKTYIFSLMMLMGRMQSPSWLTIEPEGPYLDIVMVIVAIFSPLSVILKRPSSYLWNVHLVILGKTLDIGSTLSSMFCPVNLTTWKESIKSNIVITPTSRPYIVNWPPKKTSMSHICPKTFTRFSSSQRMNL